MEGFYDSEDYDDSIDEYNFFKAMSEPAEDESRVVEDPPVEDDSEEEDEEFDDFDDEDIEEDDEP